VSGARSAGPPEVGITPTIPVAMLAAAVTLGSHIPWASGQHRGVPNSESYFRDIERQVPPRVALTWANMKVVGQLLQGAMMGDLASCNVQHIQGSMPPIDSASAPGFCRAALVCNFEHLFHDRKTKVFLIGWAAGCAVLFRELPKQTRYTVELSDVSLPGYKLKMGVVRCDGQSCIIMQVPHPRLMAGGGSMPWAWAIKHTGEVIGKRINLSLAEIEHRLEIRATYGGITLGAGVRPGFQRGPTLEACIAGGQWRNLLKEAAAAGPESLALMVIRRHDTAVAAGQWRNLLREAAAVGPEALALMVIRRHDHAVAAGQWRNLLEEAEAAGPEAHRLMLARRHDHAVAAGAAGGQWTNKYAVAKAAGPKAVARLDTKRHDTAVANGNAYAQKHNLGLTEDEKQWIKHALTTKRAVYTKQHKGKEAAAMTKLFNDLLASAIGPRDRTYKQVVNFASKIYKN
jgi:hypothetical protein